MSITAMRADRIEKTLSADPAARRVLGPKTHTICTPSKGERKYCAEVIAVAQAIDEAGEDASKLTIHQIRNFAMPIILAKMQGKPLPTIRPEFLASASAAVEPPAKPKKPAKKETLPPKMEAADAVASRRKKPEPKAATPAKARLPKAEPEPKPEPEPEPEPESLEGEAEPAVPSAKPLRQPEPRAEKPEPKEPKVRAAEPVEESNRDKLPYVVGVAASTLVISAMNLLEQYDKKDLDAYRTLDTALTQVTKITHIPNPCAKEVPAAVHRDDAS
jgi:hypothetical protein